MTHHMTQNSEMKECVDNCRSCSQACLELISHCLEKGGDHAEPRHITLLQVCADICDTSARAMILGFENHGIICGACAEICNLCATECESFDDDEMKKCAEVCRQCADSCEQMAKSAGGKRSFREKESRPPVS